MISFPGPTAALIELPVPPDADGLARVLHLETLVRTSLAWVDETVPAFNRLLVMGAVRDWDEDAARRQLSELAARSMRADVRLPETSEVVIPACYETDLAPDLASVASAAGLSAADLARLHSGQRYTVLATGFAPGFAYLGDVDPVLAVGRHRSPRPRVEAGSIGIADRRTGVYPSSGPGGWQLVGRVPAAYFSDPSERISRFQPGGRVRFRPISLADYRSEA